MITSTKISAERASGVWHFFEGGAYSSEYGIQWRKTRTETKHIDFDKEKRRGEEVGDLQLGWEQELVRRYPHTVLQMWETRYSQD